MQLTKALVEVLDDDAVDPARGLPKTFEVQFNPTEYALEKSAQLAEIAIPGIDSPILQFIRGQNEKLSLDLFFDTTEFGMDDQATSVTTLTRSFYQLVKIQPRTHAPPRIRFSWGGDILSFRAVVESVQQKFTLFNPKGVPLRATLSVVLREYKTLEEQLTELNLQTADHSRVWEIAEGDTLAEIAGRVYGDPRQWRLIADAPANLAATADPLRLTPGTVLAIPPIDVIGAPPGGRRP
jgi:Contractile injection system tube protein